jgi:hypothetical protein
MPRALATVDFNKLGLEQQLPQMSEFPLPVYLQHNGCSVVFKE